MTRWRVQLAGPGSDGSGVAAPAQRFSTTRGWLSPPRPPHYVLAQALHWRRRERGAEVSLLDQDGRQLELDQAARKLGVTETARELGLMDTPIEED